MLHVVGRALDQPTARLHVRVNGRRLGVFVQPEAELPGVHHNEQQQQQYLSPQPSPRWKEDEVDAETSKARDDNDGGYDDDEQQRQQRNLRQAEALEGEGDERLPAEVSFGVVESTSARAAQEDMEEQQQREGRQCGRSWPELFKSAATTAASGASATDAVAALVYVDAPTEAGLALLEWEDGSSGGVLGPWWPVVVAPNVDVAAEVNALTWNNQQRCKQLQTQGKQRVHVPTKSLGLGSREGNGEGTWRCAGVADDDEDEGEAVEEEEVSGADGSWLHQLLTDLGLVLDALHSSSSNSSSDDNGVKCSDKHDTWHLDKHKDKHDDKRKDCTKNSASTDALCCQCSCSMTQSLAAAQAAQLFPLPSSSPMAEVEAGMAPDGLTALGLQPEVLDCYVRRARRLLPFCLARYGILASGSR